MQTFLPRPSYADSAKCLDNKRLGKQRVENLQIAKSILTGSHITAQNARWYKNGPSRIGKRTPWYNHPAVAMWSKNLSALVVYHEACVAEWISRGYGDTTESKMRDLLAGFGYAMADTSPPPFIGDDDFHSSHRAILLDKDNAYYSSHGWGEVPAKKHKGSYPYFWPTKEKKYEAFYASRLSGAPPERLICHAK
jgi:hypothetical protein